MIVKLLNFDFKKYFLHHKMIIQVHLWTKTSLMYIHVEHFLSKICISREFLVRRSDISFCHWTQKYILQHFFTNLYLLYVFEHVRDESSLWEPKNVKPEFMRYVLLHYKYSLGPIAYCEYKNIYFYRLQFNSFFLLVHCDKEIICCE